MEHHYYVVHARDKYATLKRIADNYPDCYAIIFCRTRMETKEVAEKLMADGYNSDALHGDLSQAQRDHVMNKFRNKSLQMLVATDVAARGLDVSELSHAINYSLPDDPEIYIHRSGRTGRAGKSGISVSIIHMKETGKIKHVEKLARKTFERKMVPSGEEICEKQLFNLIDRVVNVETNDAQIDKYMSGINEKLGMMSKEELLKKFVSIEFNRFLAYYKNARDLNLNIVESKQKRSNNANFSNVFINAGKKHNLNAAAVISMINTATKRRDVEIGRIDIQRKFSFFQIDSQFADILIQALNGTFYEGHQIRVDKVIGDIPSARYNENSRRKESFHGKSRRGSGRPNEYRKRKSPNRK